MALGWRSRRIVGQVLGESVTIGIIGGLGGIVLGFAGAALVSRLAPPLTATTGLTTGSATGLTYWAEWPGYSPAGTAARTRRSCLPPSAWLPTAARAG